MFYRIGMLSRKIEKCAILFRRYLFLPVRDLCFFWRELRPLTGAGKILPVLPSDGVTPVIASGNATGLNIHADLYKPRETNMHSPAVLLLHGSSPQGRKAPLVKVLAAHLAARGIMVIAPDARGFGLTGNPPERHLPSSWDVSDDIDQLLQYIVRIEGVDRKRIYVVGHSLGANHLLEGAIDHSIPAGLVCIGPTRYKTFTNNDSSFWCRLRFSSDRKLSNLVSRAVMQNVRMKGDITGIARCIGSDSLRMPMLLLDGEYEDPRSRQILEEAAILLGKGVKYSSLPGAGHYCGVYSLFTSKWSFVKHEVFLSFVDTLEDFFRTAVSRKQ
jgi:pimeloyl-ACP methyl ester carboxylesterase